MTPKNTQKGEEEIFALRKQIDAYLRVGDTAEVERLRVKISELQKTHGAVKGADRRKNAREA